MTSFGTKVGAFVLLCITVVAAALLLLTYQITNSQSANAAEAAQFCASFAPRFMAYDKGTGTNNFGPAVNQRQLTQVETELKKTLCTDTSILYDIDLFNHGGADVRVDDVARGKEIVRLASNSAARSTLAKQVYDTVVQGSPSISTSTAAYESMAHVKGSTGDIPTLRKANVGNVTSTLISYKAGNSTRSLRLECRFQPFAPHLGVPTTNVPPKPGTPKQPPSCTSANCTPGCKVNCTPPPHTCPPSMPHGHWPVCKDGPDKDPAQQGNVPTQVTGKAPPVTSPAKPPAASPPTHYEPPAPPTQPQPTQTHRDPAPPPATGAPPSTDPGTHGACAPGIPSC